MTQRWDPTNTRPLELHFPAQRPADASKRVYELAIAAAGGTSTGAYIAGVLDFLMEALEEWTKVRGQGAPDHEVRLTTLVGCSAGGLSVSLAALMATRAFPHVYPQDVWDQLRQNDPSLPARQDRSQNPLYRAWVQEITLAELLSHPEDAEKDEVAFFHDAPKRVREEVFDLIGEAPIATGRTWVSHPLDLRLVIGNLRGVDYALDFANLDPDKHEDQRLTLHRDHMAFSLQTRAAGGVATGLGDAPDAHLLDPAAFPMGAAWERFGVAALASAAIPLVFRTVDVSQEGAAYDWRNAWFETEPFIDLPVWLPEFPASSYDFTATDGGVFDGSPFDLARRRLAGQRGQNPRTPEKACRSVLLIDPIVDEGQTTPQNPSKNPFDLIMRLVFAPIEQSQVSNFDLAQIKHEHIYSRYMIAPSRPHPTNPARRWGPSLSLQTLPMRAIMGFAHEAYREHDFFLGRYNAWRFLKRHFSLPEDSPFVDGHKDKWLASDVVEKPGRKEYPIIPLRGRAAIEPQPPEWRWQALKDKGEGAQPGVETYGKLLSKRLDGLYKNLKDRASVRGGPLAGLFGGFLKTVLNIAWSLGLRGRLVEAFEKGLKAARDAMNPSAKHRV